MQLKKESSGRIWQLECCRKYYQDACESDMEASNVFNNENFTPTHWWSNPIPPQKTEENKKSEKNNYASWFIFKSLFKLYHKKIKDSNLTVPKKKEKGFLKVVKMSTTDIFLLISHYLIAMEYRPFGAYLNPKTKK